MAECKQCGTDYEAKRSTSSYCSPKCKQEFYRNRMKGVTVTLVTAKETKNVTVTDKPKRGKDIKCFEDLPPDVQETIKMMSQRAGKIDPIEKAKRTAAAIKYQHLFPDRYENQSTVLSGVAVTGKPGDADYNGVCTEAWRAERGR